MSRLESRLLTLERRLPTIALFACAVVRAPLPANDVDGWAEQLLSQLGWSDEEVAVWVVDGPEPEVLLPITGYSALKDEAERIWIDETATFPQVMIATAGGVPFVLPVSDGVDLARCMVRLQGEIAKAA